MRLEYEQELNGIMDDFDRDIVRTLSTNTFREHIGADMEAHDQLDIAREWMVIDQSAMNYLTQYRRLLIEDGATVINGQKIPWMKSFSQEARVRVAEIIEEGIAEGLYPGRRETGVGTYPKDSTAAKLKVFFHDRKSHAAMVARTETAHVRAMSKVNRWEERNYSIVKIFDGRGANPCDVCRQIDGQYWTVEYYKTHDSEHPNCTRTASPVRAESIPAGEYIWGLGNLPAPITTGEVSASG